MSVRLFLVGLAGLALVACGKSDSSDELFDKPTGSGGSVPAGGSGGIGQGGTGGSAGTGQGGTGGTAGTGQGGTGAAPAACSLGSFICVGDALKACLNPDQGFSTVATCEPGLCDAANGQCDTCRPTDAMCVDDGTAARCDPTGQQMVSEPCGVSTPHCVQDGLCVECTGPSHCPLSTSECLVAVCKEYDCGFEPVVAGTGCGVGGTCDGNGLCTYCVPGQTACSGAGVPMQCDAQGQWVGQPACGSSAPYCKDGVCVQCLSVSHCPLSGNECMAAACSANGSCGFTAKAAGTLCSDLRQCDGKGACLCQPGARSCLGETPRTCSSSGVWVNGTPCAGGTPACLQGTCVQCTSAYHCPAAAECMTAVCSSNHCSETPSPYGTSCPGGICDGQGVCKEGTGGTGGGAGGGSYAAIPSYLEGSNEPPACGPKEFSLFGNCVRWR